MGLPVAISSKLILEGDLGLKGVEIPVHRQIYEPVLSELREYGIEFTENEINISTSR
ncbi:MAG: hypothetical protein ACP5E3_13060 [Bacteroidales bacterium]